jgi:hypothetical protein
VRLDGLQSSECCAGVPLCSGAQPGASQCSIGRCYGLAERLTHTFCALVCMDRAMDALRESVRGRHVGRCRMSFVWVPSMSVALVGPHASVLDDVRLSDRVFCVCDLDAGRVLVTAYRIQRSAGSAQAFAPTIRSHTQPVL